jgi:hypothetical protein
MTADAIFDRYPDKFPPGETGVLPISQIEYRLPTPPLVSVFMGTEEATILYGPGGATKGTTAAWWALRHVREDREAVVYLLDFEHHESEWTGRLERLGATPEEQSRIYYASPYAKEWTAARGFLADVAELIAEDCDRLGVTLLVVDSMTVATPAGEAMGGQQAATDYFDGLNRIGRRSLNLAHVRGDSAKWPDRPFGSVQIHNLARETWAVAVVQDGGEVSETAGLTSTEVELRCKKASDRLKPKPQVITYTYEPDHGAITVTEGERSASHAEMVLEALVKTPDEWMTGKAIAAAVMQDTGENLSEAQVYDAIRRDKRDRFEQDKSRRPFKVKVKATV